MTQVLVSETIEAVADSEDIESEGLEVTLEEHIDLDAANQLAEQSNSTWTLRFELPEHSVVVTSDGVILVDGQPEQYWLSA